MSEEEDIRLKKESYKEAMREFLEEQKFAVQRSIGQWVLHTSALVIVGALGYLALWTYSGFKHQ